MTMSDDLIERVVNALFFRGWAWGKLEAGDREEWRRAVAAVLSEAAAQPPAPKLCGCADAERTYEQLLDYTAELGAELDRQRVVVRAAEALVECVNEGHDLDDNSDHPLWNRLDALATAVRALLEGEGR